MTHLIALIEYLSKSATLIKQPRFFLNILKITFSIIITLDYLVNFYSPLYSVKSYRYICQEYKPITQSTEGKTELVIRARGSLGFLIVLEP